ncbi:MAG TPA: hypothetical protein VHX88_12525 [Solirubrobacteraceae bacterium]|jgi:hypothetical protein|nr:hypothetical protein [Solirubrobacteraceae bacterium]
MYLVVLSFELAGGEAHTRGELADALIERDEVATVWLADGGRPSRVALDLESESPEAAGEAGRRLVTEAAEAAGFGVSMLDLRAGTDRERLLAYTAQLSDRASPAGPSPA